MLRKRFIPLRRECVRVQMNHFRGAILFCQPPQASLALLASHGVTEVTLLRSFNLPLRIKNKNFFAFCSIPVKGKKDSRDDRPPIIKSVKFVKIRGHTHKKKRRLPPFRSGSLLAHFLIDSKRSRIRMRIRITSSIGIPFQNR